jgi:isoleucyl-tRNA synthetase
VDDKPLLADMRDVLMDYKDTVNLPKTSFPMKANLGKLEQELLEGWEQEHIYQKLRQKYADRPKYILHDGPPYANGHIHLGTAFNKILKDFVVRVKSMEGYDAVYVPGWDCHGLPIEHQVDLELGDKKAGMSKADIRRRCRAFAERFIDIQREEFKRLGGFADWEHPYLTMSYAYEATIVRELGRFFGRGGVYKGLKPVHWCVYDQTALAEAEVEYEDRTDESIWVKFPLTPESQATLPFLQGKQASVLIWTTTPWTLPANLAVAFHPSYEYVWAETDGEVLLLAKELAEPVLQKLGFPRYHILHTMPGEALEGLKARHPFMARDSVFILGEHVTLEQGTGCVHTAPGHGQEDYEMGIKYHLEIYNPVGDDGRFVPETPLFAGTSVWEANALIVDKLRADGFLLKEERITHSYPHCWRCKNPVIFRGTAQWFISMEANDLRRRALEEIRRVQWIPPWGEERIYNMVESRPDWCISRQRAWGVPITTFYCQSCQATLARQELAEHVANLVEQEGADVWFERDAADLLPPGYRCPECGGNHFTKETDILDVWFDSGVSHAAVLEPHPDLTWPADLYLEGSDQHRGWFHTSLLTAVGTRDRAPFESVLTHGFTVDAQGRKMSKSLGNVVAPQEVIEKHGAEILRLWVASENFREDVRGPDDEITGHLVEVYRRVRNTCRFLLGNLADFDSMADRLPYAELQELDRLMLHRLQKTIERVRRAYHDHEYHIVFHTLHNFCVVDLSSFYLDVLKDTLYTARADAAERRSAQTVLHETLLALVKLMAPILAFTAEEIWGYLPTASREEASVHLSEFPQVNPAYVDEELAARWERLLEVRAEILKALEQARHQKLIGTSLEAAVDVYVPAGERRDLLEAYAGTLADICIISALALYPADAAPAEAMASDIIPELKLQVRRAAGLKCVRCWHWCEDVGQHPEHPTLCGRCVARIA